MKSIAALIPPARVDPIWEQLRKIPDLPGMTLAKVEVRYADNPARGIRSEMIDFAKKVRVEIIVPEELVEGVLKVFYSVCHTGRPGDGVVWVTPVEDFCLLRERR